MEKFTPKDVHDIVVALVIAAITAFCAFLWRHFKTTIKKAMDKIRKTRKRKASAVPNRHTQAKRGKTSKKRSGRKNKRSQRKRWKRK